MDKAAMRVLVRQTIRDLLAFWNGCNRIERNLLGGFADDVPQVMQAMQQLLARGLRGLEEHGPLKGGDEFRDIEKILRSAACPATEEQINSDEWIDGVIHEIQESYKGVPLMGDDGIFIYDPEV